jgi:hypothetical protein
VITLTLAFGLSLNFKISRYQLCSSEPKSAITNLITYVDFFLVSVGSQRQADDAIYFERNNAFDFIPHYLLLGFLVAT